MPARAAPVCSTRVGDITLTFLPDGIHHVRPLAQFAGSTPDHFPAHSELLDADGWLVMSLGSLLVDAAGRRLLIDLGWGPRYIDIGDLTAGQHEGDMIGGSLLVSLASVGLTPNDVDGILYSHLHPDHVGWLCNDADGVATFPNATHYVGTQEWSYWTEGPEAGTVVAPSAARFDVMQQRLELVDEGFCPAPGVQFMLTPGHTPGHCSFVISSGAERAVVLGDAIHCPIEVSAPELDFVFDVDPVLARQTKERIEKELEQPNTVAAGGHFPDLVFGRLMQDAAGQRLDFAPSQVVAA